MIIESRETHSGLVKKDKLWKDVHADVFAPFADKIEWIILDTLGPVEDGVPLSPKEIWAREAAQRNAATDWLRRQKGPYLAIICDCDEIVNPAVIAKAKTTPDSFDSPGSLQMDFFYYNFDWLKPAKWYHPYISSDRGMEKCVVGDGSTLSMIRLQMCMKGHLRAIPDAG